MSRESEGFEGPFIPEQSYPELTAYLEAHQDVDPATVVLLHHIPPLIGGLKSNQFIIRHPEATPDTPPDPDARMDLGKTIVHSSEMTAFANFLDRSEAQADSQYEVALFETQQLLAEATDRGIDAKILFIPDIVNSSAQDYFRRLTRLAQDTGISVAMRVVDHEDGETYQSFKLLKPVEALSVDSYWDQRENARKIWSAQPVRLGNYSIYTMERVYKIDEALAANAVADIALPVIRVPLVFTSFDQIQKDYPNSPISDPAVWEVQKDRHELVPDIQEYRRVNRERDVERNNLRDNMYHAATLPTEELRQLLLGDTAPQSDKLPIIRELAVDSGDWNTAARMILAKLGDKESAQLILQEIQDKAEAWGYESLTTAPLGIHLRHDQQLFYSVVDEVKATITKDPGDSHRLLPLLGALYHSHDPRLGELLASYLTVPERNVEAYAGTVLNAVVRWMPEYTMGLAYQPASYQRDRSLRAIETQTAAFIDAHNQGKLENIDHHMMFGPDLLLPLLFWFSNPVHRPILAQSVMMQFKEGGSILTDREFEETYLLYRARYGDLPEISQHIRRLSE